MDRRRNNPKVINILLAVLCILVFAVFVGFLVWSRQESALESARLQELAEEQQRQERAVRLGETEAEAETAASEPESGEDTSAAERESASEETESETRGEDAAEETESSAQPPESESETAPLTERETQTETESETAEQTESETETESESQETESEETAAAQATAFGISCWGDEFYEDEAAEQYSYRSALQRILEENGYEMTVANKTLVGSGSLSVMKMAGVAQEELDAYIEDHRASGKTLAVTETGLRDLTEEELDRWERDYIPVLMMGYYGGWNNNIQELIGQQRKVLETFGENKDNFIIVGLRPVDKTVSTEVYNAAMEGAWGEHYINTTNITTYSLSSPEGQEAIAQAIYQRLLDLGYLGSSRETES